MSTEMWSPATAPLASQVEVSARYRAGDPIILITFETITDYVPAQLDSRDTRSLGEWLIKRADQMDRRHT